MSGDYIRKARVYDENLGIHSPSFRHLKGNWGWKVLQLDLE